MNGPEHYREAERLLEAAKTPVVINIPHDISEAQAAEIKERYAQAAGATPVLVAGNGTQIYDSTLAAAQVHATLALAAATAATRTIGPIEGWGGRDVCVEGDWSEVTS